MRYLLTRSQPVVSRILLIESGSRSILEDIIPGIRQTWGDSTPIDLVTCFAGLPEGLNPDTTAVFRVADFTGPDGPKRLHRELAAQSYSVLGMICAAEPIMTKWKWYIALRLPAKAFVVNENCDYFWIDHAHAATVRNFMLYRMGLGGAGAVRTIARLLLFPLTLCFLVLYASVVHLRRILRLHYAASPK
ncbi:MAG: hypothetical protein M3Z23_17770 [Acidobacteriota bacterium]|nr:hypothetical protein [Acidobacteriota bacterium]